MNEKGTGHPPATGTPNSTNYGNFVSQNPSVAKRFQTLRAELALAGFECRECIKGGFLVLRWNLTKYCSKFADLEQFAAEVGK